ncbi:MAG: hypothetical protein JWO87_2920 [Phycisphaerales bacterium]|nr:hypothetical protein [Phycisphaerales bacterium]
MGVARNPFPGMNPYLEQRWGDVHAALVTYARDRLQEALPDDLRARMQERVFIETEPGISSEIPADQITESYIEIIDARSGGRVITVIEIISRANKAPGPGRDLYLRKQADVRSGNANLVEIDLLRGGQLVSMALPELISPEHKAPYHVSVFRASAPTWLEYYGAPLRRALPTIRVPLRATDLDGALNLQELVDMAYQRGRYDDIDYLEPLRPSLPPDDAAWVDSILKTAGIK